MISRTRHCLLGIALVASPAAAGRHLPAPATAVRLVAPAPGAQLVAGGKIAIAWEPGAEFAIVEQRSELEEWELFLSYDDGRSWPVRLTPHLDAERRQFETELPEIASETARFMMRIGNERIESEIELAGRWRIAPGRIVRGAGMHALAGVRFRGESARAGGTGAALWLEGTRGGARLHWRSYDDRRPSASDASWGGALPRMRSAMRNRAPAIAAAAAFAGPPLATLAIPAAFPLDAILVPSISPLGQGCRRNE